MLHDYAAVTSRLDLAIRQLSHLADRGNQVANVFEMKDYEMKLATE